MKKNTIFIFSISLIFSTLLVSHEVASYTSYNDIQKAYAEQNGWGLLATIDLKGCNPEKIRSAHAIQDYVFTLCERINMQRFGDMQLIHFGEDEAVAGYSMTQLIETSLISGHFANATNAAYIDIFSCKLYDPFEAAQFTKEFFQAESCEMTIIIRKK